MGLVTPTYAAGSWNTEYTLSLDNIYDQLLDPHKLATPTLRILLANMKRDTLGPDEKWGWDLITKHISPAIATENYRFEFPDIDNITQQEWTPIKLANGAGTNDVRWKHYQTNKARFNHINTKVDSIHQGQTNALNYLLFSDYAETITARRIDISSELSSLEVPPEELYLKGVSVITDLPYSIPMLTRKVVTGYTLGNIPVTTTTNLYWHPTNTDAAGATVTRAGAGNNVDVVTAITAATCKELDLDDVFGHLNSISQGWQYNWLAACPADLYGQLRNLVLAMNIRPIDSPLAELGIRAPIVVDEYNVTFYQEPMMTALWPYSIFFYDTDAMFLQADSDFDPTSGTGIYEWERIPGTNMWGTAIYMNFQLCRPDARGVSAMHGYKKS